MSLAIADRPPGVLAPLRRLRVGWSCASETRFALVTSIIWAVAYNGVFWHQTVASMWQATPGSVAFLLSLFVVVACVQAILLMLMPSRAMMRAAASVLFPVAAVSSYFCSTYGAIMSQDMLRSVIETDPAEIGGLVTGELIATLLLLGLLPAVLVWRVSLPATSLARGLKGRAIFFGAALLACVIALFASSANYAVFFREHKAIRFTLLPAAPVWSLVGVLSANGARASGQPPVNLAGNSVRATSPQSRPLVLFIVVGETARAGNFQLGGYRRATNPALRSLENLVYFGRASACATSTALSVPCMFSQFGRGKFDADVAGDYTNLLDALVEAGFEVEWRDNNSGCKGVCERVTVIDYSKRRDPVLCPHANCFDEIMLTDLEERLRQVKHDTVIVFHQIGSHGPAYSSRYPDSFARFTPACGSNQLQQCTGQELVNAYDNTIAYTDHVLARQIELLRKASNHVDGMLIYASDHGESLGEQGLYLHGIPYAFAPQTQKNVPMLLWTSTTYDARVGLHEACVRGQADRPVSHDNLYHTVLGAAGVRNQAYEPQLDILSGCRTGGPAGGRALAALQ